jgi:acetyl-CoA C-acetyltransferase
VELRGGQLPQGETPPPFDLLYWNSDSTNLPGPYYAWYLRQMYLENNLVKPGKTTVCGEKIDFRQVKLPVYIYGSARRPHRAHRRVLRQHADLPGQEALRDGRLGSHRGRDQPASKNKRSHWIGPAGKFPADAKDWIASATEHPGSWWTDWSACSSRWLASKLLRPRRMARPSATPPSSPHPAVTSKPKPEHFFHPHPRRHCMEDIVIVSAARTAVGKFGGTLAKTPATELGSIVIKALLERTGLPADAIGEVIMGQVLAAGVGQNPARQAMMKAGVAKETPALTINAVCGSGLKAVMLAAQAVAWGDSEIVIAGGQENMSASPHVLNGSRDGQRMGDWKMTDTMIVDGLWDVYNQYHMGITAENVAKEHGISRDAQDALALGSQQKASAAQDAGKFKDEIVGVSIAQRKGDPILFNADEFINKKTSAEALAGLRPAFDKAGSVTAGNASGINDGAAAVVVMTAKKAAALGLKPLARIAAFGTSGLDPATMGMGPVPASKKALARAGWKASDVDLFELNEAFAAQACAVNKALDIDPARVNVNGGAIAIGHPIGASGCRILVTLLHEMQRRDAKKGLAALCIGGGMGVSLAVER